MTKVHSQAPDFLGIGAQKAATRWLYYLLEAHPSVYMPPQKEIHYFDRPKEFDPLLKRLRYPRWKSQLKKIWYKKDWSVKSWYVNYVFGRYTDQWYFHQFRRAPASAMIGEITPEYGILSTEEIRHIHTINPDMRLILLLRHPVDRAWSHFRRHVRKSKLDYSSLTEEEVFTFLRSEGCVRRGDYATQLKNWWSVFPKDQVFVGYYEEVKESPAELIQKILDFLRLDAPQQSIESLTEVVSEGQYIAREEAYDTFLRQQYQPKLEELATLMDSPYVADWLTSCK